MNHYNGALATKQLSKILLGGKKVGFFLLFYLMMFIPAGTSAQTYPKVGLVISGGGAKGAAVVGVLKVLEEQGIEVDCISGTSIGAIVGALYAAGYRAEEQENMFREQDWIPLLTDHRDDLWATPYKKIGTTYYVFGFPIYDEGNSGLGVLKANQVETYIRGMLKDKGCKTFEDLEIPFYCVATDMDSVEQVVFHQGEVTKAVRASMAIPAIFKTVNINGRRLVDGGAVNNLPIDILIENEKPDIVITIDLTQKRPTKNEMDDATIQSYSPYLQFVAQLIGLGNITKWLFAQPQVDSYYRNLALMRDSIDLYINPRLGDYSYSSFSKDNISDMIRMGEEAARKGSVSKQLRKIGELQQFKRRIKSNLEKTTIGHFLYN